MENNGSNIKRNFIYNSIYQLTAIMIPLITTPYLTRILGVRGLGIYSYTFSLATYFSLFIKLGLDNYGNRTIAFMRGQKKEISSTFWNIYISQFILGIIIIIIYLIYCFMFSGQYYNVAILQVIYLISVMLDITWFFAGMELFKVTVTRDFIVKISTTILIFVCVHDRNGAWVYTLIVSLGFLLSQLFLWLNAFKYVSISKPNLKEVCRHIKPNLVLFVPAVAVSFYKTLDKIMLGLIAGTIEVGYYESSERLLNVPLALVSSLGIVMLPRMSNLIGKKAEHRFKELIEKSIIFAMLASTTIGFGIMTVAKEFVPLFFGKGYEKCVILLYFLLPSCIFIAFGNVIQTQYLIPRRKDTVYILALFIGAITNIIINIILIPKIGSYGAAIGTLLAETSVCVYETWKSRGGVELKRIVVESIPFLISGLVMFIFVQPIFVQSVLVTIIVKVLIGAIIYLSSLYILVLALSKFNNNSILVTIIKKKN